jgi:outer membrane receptor for ferrienterochelin and colicin
LRGRAFVNSVKDRISLVDQMDGTYRYENINTFYAEGFAMDFSQRLDLWTLQGGFLLTGRKQQLSADGELSKMLYTPEWTGSVTLNLSDALSLNANCKHNGSQPRYVSDGEDGTVLSESQPYTMIDLQAQWQWKKESRIQVGVNNLWDVTNVDIVGGGGVHSSGNNWIAWGRSYVVTISHQIQFQKR